MSAGRRRPGWRAFAALALALAGLAPLNPATAAPAASAPVADCAALRGAYRSALPAAQVCDLASTSASLKACSARRVAALEDACHCELSVNPARTQVLDQLMADYRAQGCGPQPGLCNRMCATPGGACGSASGAAGQCGQR